MRTMASNGPSRSSSRTPPAQSDRQDQRAFRGAGFKIIAQKRLRLSRAEAGAFYAVHKARPFFNDLCTFMTSGPVVVQVLEAENAVAATATSWAPPIRRSRQRHHPRRLRGNRSRQFVHGSDSLENAMREIASSSRKSRSRVSSGTLSPFDAPALIENPHPEGAEGPVSTDEKLLSASIAQVVVQPPIRHFSGASPTRAIEERQVMPQPVTYLFKSPIKHRTSDLRHPGPPAGDAAILKALNGIGGTFTRAG
jgi:nucleoside-diphosphate kinase